MPDAVIIDAVRTPLGRRGGVLSGWHPADLGAHVLRELVARNDLDPAAVDDVVMGCVTQIGRQAANLGRYAVLGAGFPESVPATTVDRQCGSSQQALHFAAQGVKAGAYDVVIAAGVEVMSTTPMGSAVSADAFPFGEALWSRYGEVETKGVPGLPHQGVGAELLAERWELARDELDEYSVRSHHRAARARDEGRFDGEIVPLPERALGEDGTPGAPGAPVTADEGIRADSDRETLARLKPAFFPDGVTTAGSASQISDGAAAVLITSEERAEALGLRPKARVHTTAVVGVDPVMMLHGPILATTRVLERAGLALDDVDHVEINEAFASVVLAWAREHDADPEKVNPNGGAIALGHPLGASGARLLTTMVHELERTGGRFGLQTMCEGGGMANATIIERL